MSTSAPRAHQLKPRRQGRLPWKLEDAKARFSELVRRAHDEGPQAVTVRGKPSVVVVDADEYERLTAATPAQPLVPFLEALHLDGLDLARDRDAGREIEL